MPMVFTQSPATFDHVIAMYPVALVNEIDMSSTSTHMMGCQAIDVEFYVTFTPCKKS